MILIIKDKRETAPEGASWVFLLALKGHFRWAF
jgi:hypothetical protein